MPTRIILRNFQYWIPTVIIKTKRKQRILRPAEEHFLTRLVEVEKCLTFQQASMCNKFAEEHNVVRLTSESDQYFSIRTRSKCSGFNNSLTTKLREKNYRAATRHRLVRDFTGGWFCDLSLSLSLSIPGHLIYTVFFGRSPTEAWGANAVKSCSLQRSQKLIFSKSRNRTQANMMTCRPSLRSGPRTVFDGSQMCPY